METPELQSCKGTDFQLFGQCRFFREDRRGVFLRYEREPRCLQKLQTGEEHWKSFGACSARIRVIGIFAKLRTHYGLVTTDGSFSLSTLFQAQPVQT